MFQSLKVSLASAALAGSSSAMVVISEFEPNPAGADPDPASFEIAGGTPGAAFDLWVVSLESDGFNGTVDRVSNITGTYDANGLAVAMIGDLENPSFTVILSESFSGSVTDDLDAMDDGNLDLSPFGTILDAVAISDNAADDAVIQSYANTLGGSAILFNGQFEPLSVFRDASTGDFYQTVTSDFGQPTERISVFAANGGPELDSSIFSSDPLSTTYGAINPTAIPEPSSALLGGIALLSLLAHRRK